MPNNIKQKLKTKIQKIKQKRLKFINTLFADGAVLESCDFDDDNDPFCDFRVVSGSAEWRRRSGSTPSDPTGPNSDVSGNGKRER